MAARAGQQALEVAEMGDLGPSVVESPPLAAVHSVWGRPRMNNDETRSLTTFDGESWCQEVPLNLLIILVPCVRGESTRISRMLFCAN